MTNFSGFLPVVADTGQTVVFEIIRERLRCNPIFMGAAAKRSIEAFASPGR